MRIEITGRRLEITDAISSYTETKCRKLLKYFDGVQQIGVILDMERRDHREEFCVEVILNIVRHDPIVAKADSDDIYTSVDLAVDKAIRQLSDHKEKLREHH